MFASLRLKFVLFISTSIILISAILILSFTIMLNGILRNKAKEKVQRFLNLFIESTYYAILQGERILLQEAIERLLLPDEDVIFVSIFDSDGKELATRSKIDMNLDLKYISNTVLNTGTQRTFDILTPDGFESFFIAKPVLVKMGERENKIGAILIGFTMKNVEQTFRKTLAKTLLFWLFGLIISVTLTYLLVHSNIINPVLQIWKSFGIASRGDFTYVPKIRTGDEVGLMAESFEKMMNVMKNNVSVMKGLSSYLLSSSSDLRNFAKTVYESFSVQVQDIENIKNKVGSILETLRKIAGGIEKDVYENIEESVNVIGEMEQTYKANLDYLVLIKNSCEKILKILEDDRSLMVRISKSFEDSLQILEEIRVEWEKVNEAFNLIIHTIEKEFSGIIDELRKETGILVMESQNMGSDIRERMESIYEVVQKLDTFLNDFYYIINEIKDMAEIVDDTNILSLNASIIGLQAGEWGREFNQIAKEIKNVSEKAEKKLIDMIQFSSSTFFKLKELRQFVEEKVNFNKIQTFSSSISDSAKKIDIIATNAENLVRGNGLISSSYNVIGKVQNFKELIAKLSFIISDISEANERFHSDSEIVLKSIESASQTTQDLLGSFNVIYDTLGMLMESIKGIKNSSQSIFLEAEGQMKIIEEIYILISKFVESAERIYLMVSNLNSSAFSIERFAKHLDEITRKFKV